MAGYFNPAPCNNGALAAMAALGSTVGNVTAPFPLFYTSSKCGGGVNGASFPQYFLPVNCPADQTIPPSSANCLRVITESQYANGSVTLHPSQINYLPKDAVLGNMFSNLDDRLYSWYVPPNYTVIFFKTDPTLSLPSSIPRLVQMGDTLMVDACLGVPFLNDGITPFWDPVPGIDYCSTGGSMFFDHTAPFVVVIQNESYNSTIISMCLANKQVSLGTNSLNEVWYPQSPGCDAFMSNLCATPDTSTQEVCSCFTQQAELQKQYPNINISVCSFGSMVSGSIPASCAFNPLAYKTQAMLKNCVSFAQCVSNSQNPMVQCMGDFVQLPQVAVVTPTITPAQYTSETDIPFYAWILLGLSGALLLLCLMILAFL